MMDDSIIEFKRLLEKANQISFNPRRKKNYFEVAGYPHYENVASSIMAFYFDTHEEHGLRDLWLKSLLECYIKVSNDREIDELLRSSRFETTEEGVAREETTSDNKRLDIVIPTNNNVVVAIENKIFADIYNPFDNYSVWINQAYKQYPIKLEVVLSLKPVADLSLLDGVDSRGNKYHFVNITYKDLLKTILSNVGSYISDADEKWLIYMNEFIKNVESLQEGTMKINKEWQDFLDDNNDLIIEYNKKIKADQKSKIDFVTLLSHSLKERINDVPNLVPTKVYTFGYQAYASHVSLVIDITIDDKTTLAFEPHFLKPGFTISDDRHLGVFYLTFWVRQTDRREEVLSWLTDLFAKEGITCIQRDINGWGASIEIKQFDFSEDVDPKTVENYVVDVWKKVSDAIAF